MKAVLRLKYSFVYGALIASLLLTLVGTQPAFAARTCTIRYYISPIVGSGTVEDPLRPLVIDLPSYPHHLYATDWAMVYNRDRQAYAFVGVAAPNHKPLLHNDRLGVLPDIPLDTLYNDLTGEEDVAFRHVIDMFGMDLEAITEEADTYGDVLYQMAYLMDPFGSTRGIPTPDSCHLK
jgi:hypothetical protein